MKAVLWRPGDGRSLRGDRVPLDLRLLGRLLPLQPAATHDEQPGWLSMHELSEGIDRANRLIRKRIANLPVDLQLTSGFYPQVVQLPFGCERRELLVPGMYGLVDSSVAGRLLYVGSSVDNTMRSRLICHLFEGGRVWNAQRSFRRAYQRCLRDGGRPLDESDRLLRQSLWGRNRWMSNTEALGGGLQRAATLVAEGAFDVVAVMVPERYGVLARCLERFATELARHRTGHYPPLNDARVTLDRRQPRSGGSVDLQLARQLFADLDALARRST